MTSAVAPAVPTRRGPEGTPEPAVTSELCIALLDRLGLTFDGLLSDDGGSFVTVRCRDEANRRVVLKYIHRDSADARRRLHNETVLFQHLAVRPPLRLLNHHTSGPGYLVTEYDPGTLLRPDTLTPPITAAVAQALVRFQICQPDRQQLGITDREHVATYYLKVLLRNLLHLWPAHISTADAVRCLTIVTASLPAICRKPVICHGDFLPTNLLYDDAADSVTFTDLEGFFSRNHPLFDVLAFCSIGSRDLAEWEWQRLFVAQYLNAGGQMLGLDPRTREYRTAYHGILIFFLVYRLNEQRIGLSGGAYFDGIGKSQFVARKARRLATGRRSEWHDDALAASLEVRKRNLRRALSPFYREHLEFMHTRITG